jgi:hypothetical protein
MNIKQAQPMDCLTFCIRSMDDSIFKFAKTDAGKGCIKILKKINPTNEARLKDYILFSHTCIMSQALTQLMGNSLNVDGAIKTIASPLFTEFQEDLVNTINKNFPMLMSKLTRKQRRKLEALVA